MKKSIVSGILLAASLVMSCPSFASTSTPSNTLTPYICTPQNAADDATATIVTNAGSSSFNLQLHTAANGQSSTGAVIVDNNKNKVFSELMYNFKGTPSATNGPFVFIFGTNSAGQPASLFYPYNKNLVIGTSTKGTALRYAVSKRSPNQITIQQIVIAEYPTSKAMTSTISNVTLNSAQVAAQMTTTSGCPAGTGQP